MAKKKDRKFYEPTDSELASAQAEQAAIEALAPMREAAKKSPGNSVGRGYAAGGPGGAAAGGLIAFLFFLAKWRRLKKTLPLIEKPPESATEADRLVFDVLNHSRSPWMLSLYPALFIFIPFVVATAVYVFSRYGLFLLDTNNAFGREVLGQLASVPALNSCLTMLARAHPMDQIDRLAILNVVALAATIPTAIILVPLMFLRRYLRFRYVFELNQIYFWKKRDDYAGRFLLVAGYLILGAIVSILLIWTGGRWLCFETLGKSELNIGNINFFSFLLFGIFSFLYICFHFFIISIPFHFRYGDGLFLKVDLEVARRLGAIQSRLAERNSKAAASTEKTKS